MAGPGLPLLVRLVWFHTEQSGLSKLFEGQDRGRQWAQEEMNAPPRGPRPAGTRRGPGTGTKVPAQHPWENAVLITQQSSTLSCTQRAGVALMPGPSAKTHRRWPIPFLSAPQPPGSGFTSEQHGMRPV